MVLESSPIVSIDGCKNPSFQPAVAFILLRMGSWERSKMKGAADGHQDPRHGFIFILIGGVCLGWVPLNFLQSTYLYMQGLSHRVWRYIVLALPYK